MLTVLAFIFLIGGVALSVLLDEDNGFKNISFVLGICGFLVFGTFGCCCTVVDSGEIGIKFHKWSTNEELSGGVEGTCTGWVFYNPITTKVFTYPTFVQRKEYEELTVNAKDASIFKMKPVLAYRLNKEKASDIFVKYRKDIDDLEDGYIRTCIYEAYRTCANAYTSDSLMGNRAQFEMDVRARLDKFLGEEGFIVEEFTSQITPPTSLTDMIDQKNRAVQSAQKAENEVAEANAQAKIKVAKANGDAEALKIKADAEAYYNKTISASLSDRIIAEDWIEKWDGKLPSTQMGNGAVMPTISIK